MLRLGLLVSAVLLSGACVAASEGAPCLRHSDCPPQLTCSTKGRCALPEVPDVPEADAGADAAPHPLPDADVSTPDAEPDAEPDAS